MMTAQNDSQQACTAPRRGPVRSWLLGCGIIGLIGIGGLATLFLVVSWMKPSRQELEQLVHERQPIIAALEAYHQQKEEYPETVSALVPTYLPAVKSSVVYRREGASYELEHYFDLIYRIYYRPEGVPSEHCLDVIEGWCFSTT